MLIFFIHGVATRDVKYADPLKNLLREQLAILGKPSPHFHSSFWGNALSDVSKMWNWISQDLQLAKQEHPGIDIQETFRYKELREGFLSEFVGDMLTYLNPKRGFEIRKAIAQQLVAFLKEYPQETDLHIVAHSLGSVILWDVLFSDRFSDNDPALILRSIISSYDGQPKRSNVGLKSITTMGSPILFFNTMLDVKPEKVERFVQATDLSWMNILHSSDVIAYPLKSSLSTGELCKVKIKDKYLYGDINLAQKAALTIGRDDAAMAIGASDAHASYWHSHRTARLLLRNILDKEAYQQSMAQKTIDLLRSSAGFTKDLMRLHVKDKPVEACRFADGSGSFSYIVNAANIHHVYIFDADGNCHFGGYVGWLHIGALQKTISLIKRKFC